MLPRSLRLLGPAGLSVSFVACTALLGDFNSGAAPTGADGGEDDAAANDATTGDSRAPDSGSGSEAGPPQEGGPSSGDGSSGCTNPEIACGGACTNTATDPANCGECGHACATGYGCKTGVCGNAVIAIAAGQAQTCAVLQRGDVYCWGTNADGELGQGDAGGGSPVAVLVPRDDSQNTVSGQNGITTGESHVCALNSSGILECWGSTSDGQTSHGEYSPDGGVLDQPLPSAAYQSQGLLAPAIPYANIAVGGLAMHGCAGIEGGVFCWGDNTAGQLGHSNAADGGVDFTCGTDTCFARPYPVAGITQTPRQIAVGSNFTCAIDATGHAICWGYNYDGALGSGTRGGFGGDFTPQPVALDAGVSFVAAGDESACTVANDGSVWCWGASTNGQLGHDGGADLCCSIDCGFQQSPPRCTPTPTQVAGVTGAIQVAVGCNHACALLQNGTALCWGANDKGQLGTGDNVGGFTPRPVTGLTGATAIAAGCDHSCAITGGKVVCWGLDADGELGNGVANQNAPTPVQGLPQ